MSRRRLPCLLVAAAAAALLACAPPEAQRVRGGGPGADPGNHGEIIEMHGGSRMYHDVPCLTTRDECRGPLPETALARRGPGSN